MADRPYMCRDEGLFLPECGDCSQLEGRVKALEDCCETATEELADHEERISSAENDIDTLQEDLISAQSDIQSNTDAIDSIERLPEVTSADDGKVLTVVGGKWGINPSSLVGEAIVGQSTVGEEETESDIDELKERMLSAESNIASLEENKQNKLTAGAGIQIQNDVISTTGSGDEGKADYTRIDECNDIVSFQADAKGVPLKSLTATINPKQDLHGYDKPWAGGAGKNKLNLDTNVTVLSGSVPSAVTITSEDGSATITEKYYNRDANKFGWAFNVESNQTYAVSGNITSSANTTIKIYAADGSVVYKYVLSNSQTTFCFSFDSSTNATLYFYATIALWGQTITLNNVQIEKGTATSWTPYSNICPISGWDSANVARSGKNMADMVADGKTPSISTGAMVSYSQSTHSQMIKVNPSTAYVASFGNTLFNGVFQYDKDGNFINVDQTTTTTKAVTTTSTTAFIMLRCDRNSTSEPIPNCQFEVGNTATAYEPYQADTYTTDLPETVYGGSLDVVNGVLTVDRAYLEPASINGTGTSSDIRYFTIAGVHAPSDNQAELISSHFKSERGVVVGNAYVTGNGGTLVFVIDQSITTTADANAWLAENKPQFCYKLADPQTIQLTPKQATTLLGENNVWADSGEVCLEYEHTQGVPTLKARRTTYTTTESSEDTFALTDYTASDILFVCINGLMLVEGDEYTIEGTNIVLTTPITQAGTVVHIVALQARL